MDSGLQQHRQVGFCDGLEIGLVPDTQIHGASAQFRGASAKFHSAAAQFHGVETQFHSATRSFTTPEPTAAQFVRQHRPRAIAGCPGTKVDAEVPRSSV